MRISPLRFTVWLSVWVSLLIAAPLLKAAPDLPGAKDNPQVKRVTNSRIVLYRFKAFDEMNLPLEPVAVGDDNKLKDTKRQHIEGAHTVLYYLMPPDVGPFEVIHQYASELKEQHEAEDLWVPDGEAPSGTPNQRWLRQVRRAHLSRRGKSWLGLFPRL